MKTKMQEKIERDPRVAEVFSEFGNLDNHQKDWWVYLKNGWIHQDGTHAIHEPTLTKAHGGLAASLSVAVSIVR